MADPISLAVLTAGIGAVAALGTVASAGVVATYEHKKSRRAKKEAAKHTMTSNLQGPTQRAHGHTYQQPAIQLMYRQNGQGAGFTPSMGNVAAFGFPDHYSSSGFTTSNPYGTTQPSQHQQLPNAAQVNMLQLMMLAQGMQSMQSSHAMPVLVEGKAYEMAPPAYALHEKETQKKWI